MPLSPRVLPTADTLRTTHFHIATISHTNQLFLAPDRHTSKSAGPICKLVSILVPNVLPYYAIQGPLFHKCRDFDIDESDL